MPDKIDWPGFGRTAKPAVLDRTATFPSTEGIDLPRECHSPADEMDRTPFSHEIDDGDGPVLPGLSVGDQIRTKPTIRSIAASSAGYDKNDALKALIDDAGI
jgi:hypothetical protein